MTPQRWQNKLYRASERRFFQPAGKIEVNTRSDTPHLSVEHELRLQLMEADGCTLDLLLTEPDAAFNSRGGRYYTYGSSLIRTDIAIMPQRFVVMVREEIARRFKTEHEITDKEFSSELWQCLFAIQYPDAAA